MAVAYRNEADFGAFRADQPREGEFMARVEEIATQSCNDAIREVGKVAHTLSAEDHGIKGRGIRNQKIAAAGSREPLAAPINGRIRCGQNVPLKIYMERSGKFLSETQRQHSEGQTARRAR